MSLAQKITPRDNRPLPLLFRVLCARLRMNPVPRTLLETTERLALFETAQAAVGTVIAELSALAYAEETSPQGCLDRAREIRDRIDQLQDDYDELDYNDPESLKATIAKYVAQRRFA